MHGIAGAGKTALLRAFAADAREAGAAVVLDCRTVEPTEAGFLAALSAALGAPVRTVPEAAEALRELGERVVLVLDGFEVLTLADAWIRLTLLPALPATARIAIGSREPRARGVGQRARTAAARHRARQPGAGRRRGAAAALGRPRAAGAGDQLLRPRPPARAAARRVGAR